MPEVKNSKKSVASKAPLAVVKKDVEGKVEPKSAAPVPKVDKSAVYISTGKYNPKAEHNIKSMGEVEAVLPGTYAEIAKAIPHHIDFIGYLIRRGGLAPK